MRKIVTIIVIIIVLLSIFFIKINYKNFKFGNNRYKSADKIKKYFLGISSYESTSEITVISNKNKNTYKIKEKYYKYSNLSNIEILEPESINGTKIKYDGKNVTIENERLSIAYLYENYKYIGENDLTLAKFIEDLKECNNWNIIEEENNIIVQIQNKNGNKYNSYKKLYLNKKDLKPCKLEIIDLTQNIKAYILYNEIKINNLQDNDILAFSYKLTKNNI